jgi:hypothetical protein
MTARRPLLIAATALAVILAAVLAFIGFSNMDESAGPETGVTLNDVAEHPDRYVGKTVAISGEWEENDYFSPDDADVALVIGDDAGKKLLVIPRPGVSVPRMGEDTVVRVTGTVRTIDPKAEADGLRDTGLVRQGGLLSIGADALISATHVELTPPRRGPAERNLRFRVSTVPRLYKDLEVFEDRPVVVTGRASAVGKRGFLLTQDGRSIFVSAPFSKLEGLDPGERVRISGEVATLSRFRTQQANQVIERALASDEPGPTSKGELRDVPFSRGQPYLLLRSLQGQGPGPLTSDTDEIS